MKRIILFAAVLEISYLLLSFALAQIYGQWSVTGEVIRTVLRVISIVIYGYYYQQSFYKSGQSFKAKAVLKPPFIAAILLLMFFAVVYTNAENETLWWQFVFVVSGITAGLREELFYRGIVQKSLQLKYNHKTALLLATLLFTLSHIQYIYYGQIKGLMLIAIAGVIFGSIFIYSGSIMFTAAIHGLYDALLSVNLSPFRLNNGSVLPILFLIMVAFLILISKKLVGAPQADNNLDDSNPDNLGLG
jgi:membrane protease YdiL (CAAX protease family)